MVEPRTNERNQNIHNDGNHDSSKQTNDRHPIRSNIVPSSPLSPPQPSLPQRPPQPSSPQQPTFYYKSNADQEKIRTTLQKSIYFSCLDEEQIETFVQAVQLQQFPPGQIIITEGCIDTDVRIDMNNKKNWNDTYTDSSDVPSTDIDGTEIEINTPPPVHESQTNEIEAPDYDTHNNIRLEEHTIKSAIDDNDNDPSDTKNTGSSTPSSALLQQVSDINEENDDMDCITATNYAQHEPNQNENTTSTGDHWILNHHPKRDDRNSMHVTNLESSFSSNTDPPVPPQSGIPRSIYIIRKGNAQIWYKTTTTTISKDTKASRSDSTASDYMVNTIGPGTIFGEGGFLFGRRHSASVISAANTDDSSSTTEGMLNDDRNIIDPLECWVLDIQTFRNFVLPSENMRQIFHKYANRYTDNWGLEYTEPLYVTISDLLEVIIEYQQTDPLYMNCTTNQLNVHMIVTLYHALIRRRLVASTNFTNEWYSRQLPLTSNQQNSEARIDFNDFCFFFALLARPDPEVDVIFLLMDERQRGCIGIQDLQVVLQPIYPELDFTSQFFQRYFGPNGNQFIRFKSFSQFLVDLQREIGQQAYSRAVQQRSGTSSVRDGYISPTDFVLILSTSCGWNLPNSLVQRLDQIYCHNGNITSTCVGDEYFSFGDFMAFQDVLGNLSFICQLIRRAEEFNNGPISADDFKAVNREFGLGSRLSLRQVDVLFDLFDVNGDGYISHVDIAAVCGVNYIRDVVPLKRHGKKLAFASPSIAPSESVKDKEYDLRQKIVTWVRNACVAAVVGGVSAFLLHPIDLIKTRMMNQRKGSVILYRSPIDCMQQVLRKEGFISLFRGVQPYVLGVAIERSIKLQVHQLLQQAFHALDDDKREERKPSLLLETLAGGCAGACQLLVTNPMEITSIRMQMQGETARLLKERGLASPPPSTMVGVIKDLGFPGVYRGASACLIRDVPFSAIFFPSYVACKEVLVQHNANFTGKATAADIFYAGTIAGIPASLLTTPADVVKCRLQSIGRPGESAYSGIRDCVIKMYQNEGISAFFQGSTMRVLRIAPQFGLSLLLYENLTNFIGLDCARRPPSNLPIDPEDYLNAFPKSQRKEPIFLEKWVHAIFGHNVG